MYDSVILSTTKDAFVEEIRHNQVQLSIPHSIVNTIGRTYIRSFLGIEENSKDIYP